MSTDILQEEASFHEYQSGPINGALRGSHPLEFVELDCETKDLTLHLIAAHHGRARPHFPSHESFDPENDASSSEQVGIECPIRFARLQRRYGRWQLAWLESLVRAADYLASQTLVEGADLKSSATEEATA